MGGGAAKVKLSIAAAPPRPACPGRCPRGSSQKQRKQWKKIQRIMMPQVKYVALSWALERSVSKTLYLLQDASGSRENHSLTTWQAGSESYRIHNQRE